MTRVAIRDFGTALSFNGTSAKVTLSLIATKTNFSIAGWFNTSDPTTQRQAIFWTGVNATGGYGLFVNRDSTAYGLYFLTESAWNRATTVPVPNGWHHVVATLTTTGLVVYLDGAQVFSGAITAPGTPTGSTYIGTQDIGAFFKGNLDDVMWCNTVLTQAEVTALYYNGTTPASAQNFWRFNEATGTTATDSSGNGNTGTITAATYTADVPMKPRLKARDFGTALSFDGSDDYVSAGTTGLPIGAAARTMSCWINPSVSDGTVRYFIGYGDGASNKAFEMNHDNTRLSIDLAFVEMTYSIKFQMATWYFVASTFDGTTLKLYINGVLVNSSTPTVNTLATAGINVGRRATSGGSYYKGKIDEPTIWNVALTGAQILALYNSNVIPSGAVVQWLFNEGAGTTATDSSGSGLTGTISGGAAYTNDVPTRSRS